MSLHPVMWNETPEFKYHTLPIIVLAMHEIRVKSSLNCESKDSPTTPLVFFLQYILCGHFVA